MPQALKTVRTDEGEKGVRIREALLLVLRVCYLRVGVQMRIMDSNRVHIRVLYDHTHACG